MLSQRKNKQDLRHPFKKIIEKVISIDNPKAKSSKKSSKKASGKRKSNN